MACVQADTCVLGIVTSTTPTNSERVPVGRVLLRHGRRSPINLSMNTHNPTCLCPASQATRQPGPVQDHPQDPATADTSHHSPTGCHCMAHVCWTGGGSPVALLGKHCNPNGCSILCACTTLQSASAPNAMVGVIVHDHEHSVPAGPQHSSVFRGRNRWHAAGAEQGLSLPWREGPIGCCLAQRNPHLAKTTRLLLSRLVLLASRVVLVVLQVVVGAWLVDVVPQRVIHRHASPRLRRSSRSGNKGGVSRLR